MPVYNCEPYLKEAIDSILNQTYADFDFLIINDASTDKSEDIILSYSDPRIIYLKNETNLRLVGTLNRGLDCISTPYMVRMDGDDISTPDRLAKLLDFMESHPEIGVCGSFIETFGNDNSIWKYNETDEMIRPCIFYKSMVGHASAIFRMSVLNHHQIRYSERHIHMEDRVMWLSLFSIAKFHNLQEALYKYRILEHNVTVRNRETLSERVTRFYEELFPEFGIECTNNLLQIHLGYTDLLNFEEKEITNYITWLEKLRFSHFDVNLGLTKFAMNFHYKIMESRFVNRAKATGNGAIIWISTKNETLFKRILLVLRSKLKRNNH
ncbi:MAG: glycosyltransferase [Flavobacteriales bacterium]|nr:glycosyltransferase [Flavobacteriales bacterium]